MVLGAHGVIAKKWRLNASLASRNKACAVRVARKRADATLNVVGAIGNPAPTRVSANPVRHVIQASRNARNYKLDAMINANGLPIVARLGRQLVPRRVQRRWRAAVIVEHARGFAPTAVAGPSGLNAKTKVSARPTMRTPRPVMGAVR